MKYVLTLLLALALPPSAFAGDEPAETEKQAKAAYEQMLQEAEQARMEAESARREAARVAERAREASRMQAERAREQAESARAETEQLREERAAEEREIERAREELSRAHRELREAQREVARAHAELARGAIESSYVYTVNLGDRAVIGVVLGEETTEGVELVAVSPDGPAEKAGLETGDVLVSLGGTALAGEEGAAKARVYEVMETAKAGDEIAVVVDRDGESIEYTVTAEVREPASWQSVIRIPEAPVVPGVHDIHIETIRVPDIDEKALAERMERIHKRLEGREYQFFGDGLHEGRYEFRFEDFSDVAGTAFSDANVFFGLPFATGLELTAINEGLGAYFKTERGVLVIKADENNAYTLESGDVILKIGGTPVDTPAEFMRALREIEPGLKVEIEIKRDRRSKTLEINMPEKRLGLR